MSLIRVSGAVPRSILIGLTLYLSVALCADEAPVVSSLRWYAARAKEQGRTCANLPAVQGIPVVLTTLEEALQNYSALVVVPEATTVGVFDQFKYLHFIQIESR